MSEKVSKNKNHSSEKKFFYTYSIYNSNEWKITRNSEEKKYWAFFNLELEFILDENRYFQILTQFEEGAGSKKF